MQGGARPEDPETLRAMTNLDLTKNGLGQYADAEEAKIEFYKEVLGQRYPDPSHGKPRLHQAQTRSICLNGGGQLQDLELRNNMLGKEVSRYYYRHDKPGLDVVSTVKIYRSRAAVCTAQAVELYEEVLSNEHFYTIVAVEWQIGRAHV